MTNCFVPSAIVWAMLVGCDAAAPGRPVAASALHSSPNAIPDNSRPNLDKALAISIESRLAGVSEQQLRTWIDTAARAVANYYGKFPVAHVAINVSAGSAGHDINGRTYDGQRIDLVLGADVRSADLNDDWVLTHEMFHLAFPDLAKSLRLLGRSLALPNEFALRGGLDSILFYSILFYSFRW